MTRSSNIDEFKQVLSRSRNIVVVSGAGLSAGIPTFRTGSNALWAHYSIEDLATPTAFEKNPVLVWNFYHERRRTALSASPNAAHYALALLSHPSYLKAAAPNCERFTHVTQNVDGLNTRAYREVMKRHRSGQEEEEKEESPPNLYEMHGRLLDTLCTSCGHREHNPNHTLCPALADSASFLSQSERKPMSVEDLPRCARCGGLLRPGVVWFGEVPYHLAEIDQVVASADLCLVVGTSSTVYPAAGYAFEVAENGGTVAVFNVELPDSHHDYVHFFFEGPCEVTLPQLLLGQSAAASVLKMVETDRI